MVRSIGTLGRLALLLALSGCNSLPPEQNGSGFFVPDQGRIVSLTRAEKGRGTTITAPAALDAARPNVGQIDASRLVAPLVVIDVVARTRQARDFTFGADDLTEFEGRRGAIPAGAFVVLATGGGSVERDPAGKAPETRQYPGFSSAVVDLLVRQRNVVGIGSDAPAIDPSTSAQPQARDAALNGGRYVVTNLGGLDQVSDGRAVAFLGVPLAAVPESEVRVLALVARRAAQVAPPSTR